MNKLLWSYGKEGALFSGAFSLTATILTSIMGGWDMLIQALIMMMVADFILGFLAAAKAGKVDSRVMLWGGVNKVLVLILVAVGVLLDGIMAMNDPYIRSAIIWFYIAREGLSLVENYGRMGMHLPGFLVKLLAQIEDKSKAK